MPKEQIRKRGKRKPKNADEVVPGQGEAAPAAEEPTVTQHELPPHLDQQPQAGPSGIHPARAAFLAGRRPAPEDLPPAEPVEDEQVLAWSRSLQDAEFPFGVLDPDLKAYFRNVDDQIRDWEGVVSTGEEREDRQMFLNSVLGELRGQELAVSTDPDTAVVLERLMPSLGDWGRRVIGDAFGDSWDVLIRHRFGSHVAQTWFTLAADTLDREAKGIFPPQHHAQASSAEDVGTLPSMSALVTKIIHILQPSISTLLTNPHASPPLRLLLIVLTPARVVPALDSGEEGKNGLIRSKKSGKYRKGQAVQGKSIFGDEEDKGKGKAVARRVSDDLTTLRRDLLEGLTKHISEVEWKSMGVNPVGGAAVQLLLELESEDGRGNKAGSLLDILTEGIIASGDTTPIAGQHLATLLTTATGTRLFETILVVSPHATFKQLWSVYFVGKIGKFAGHPYANFTVAKGVSRLDADGVEEVVRECKAVSGGRVLIKTARTSVLQALVDRATKLTTVQKSVISLILSSLDLPETEKKMLVPCLMALKTYPTYQSIRTGNPVEEDNVEIPEEVLDPDAEEAAAAAARLEGWKTRRTAKPKDNDLAPNMQGCLLLQAMVRLPGGNEVVLESLLAQDVSALLEYASSPVASHLLDACLTSHTVTPKHRRKLLMAFMGHYKQLAEDRMGSRVADTIWARADGFMKEKIARSLIPDANALASSQFGRFLYGKLNLHLLERRPDEWRQKHIGVTGGRAVPVQASLPAKKAAEDGAVNEHGKREERDEIDNLFEQVEKKDKKKKRREL